MSSNTQLTQAGVDKSHPVLRSKPVSGTKIESAGNFRRSSWRERRSPSHRLGSHPSSSNSNMWCLRILPNVLVGDIEILPPPCRTRPRLSPSVVSSWVHGWSVRLPPLALACGAPPCSYRRRLPLQFLVLFATVAHLVVNLGAPAPGLSSSPPPQCVLFSMSASPRVSPLCWSSWRLRQISGSRPPS